MRKKSPPPQPPIPSGSTIVLDIGTSTTRIGVSGEDLPRHVFPTVTARPRNGRRPVYIGHDAINARGNFGFYYPVERGLIKDWKEVEQIFFHAFYTLRIASREHPMLYIEPIHSSKTDREKLIQFMFEEFNLPSYRVMNSASLALVTTGKTTGLVIESGNFQTSMIPVVEGKVMTSVVQNWNWGGLELTNYLAKLTGKSDFPGAVKDLKEKFCYVALDYDEEKRTLKSKSPQKDDGKASPLGVEQIQVAEAFFNPSLIDQNHDPLPLSLLTIIQKCDTKVQQALLDNIVLSGGNTMFPHFHTRLEKEIKKLLSTSKFSSFASSSSSSLTISAHSQRIHTPWIGGASLKTETSDCESLWVSRAEYDESGASILSRKCP